MQNASFLPQIVQALAGACDKIDRLYHGKVARLYEVDFFAAWHCRGCAVLDPYE